MLSTTMSNFAAAVLAAACECQKESVKVQVLILTLAHFAAMLLFTSTSVGAKAGEHD